MLLLIAPFVHLFVFHELAQIRHQSLNLVWRNVLEERPELVWGGLFLRIAYSRKETAEGKKGLEVDQRPALLQLAGSLRLKRPRDCLEEKGSQEEEHVRLFHVEDQEQVEENHYEGNSGLALEYPSIHQLSVFLVLLEVFFVFFDVLFGKEVLFLQLFLLSSLLVDQVGMQVALDGNRQNQKETQNFQVLHYNTV